MGRSCTGGSQAVHGDEGKGALAAKSAERNVCKDEHMCMHTIQAGKVAKSNKCRGILRRARDADGKKIKSLQTAWFECCKDTDKNDPKRASFGQGVYTAGPLSGVAKRPFCSLYTDEGAYDPNTKCTPRCGKGGDECPAAWMERVAKVATTRKEKKKALKKRDDDSCACRQELANTQCSAGAKCGGTITGDAAEIYWRKCCNNNPKKARKWVGQKFTKKFKSVGANANHMFFDLCPGITSDERSGPLWGRSMYCPGTLAEVTSDEDPSGLCDCAKYEDSDGKPRTPTC